jgi:hypothetical protein
VERRRHLVSEFSSTFTAPCPILLFISTFSCVDFHRLCFLGHKHLNQIAHKVHLSPVEDTGIIGELKRHNKSSNLPFNMDPSQVKIPPIKNLSAETITENTILINSGNPDPRFKYVLERLVSHLHDFARETRLSTKEWMAGLEFLTATGKTCTDVRQVCHDSTSV